MPRRSPSTSHTIAAAALKLAAIHPWDSLTLDHIAKSAKISSANVRKSFASTNDILPALVAFIDTELLAQTGKPDRKASLHDRLFEILMARFDILQKNRAAILNIIGAVRRNPALAVNLLQAQSQSMQFMIAHIKNPHEKMDYPLVKIGLLAIYGVVIVRWTQDNTRDLSKTMALLDRSLKRAEKYTGLLRTIF